MKKFIILLLILLGNIFISNAVVFSSYEDVDRFDDPVRTKNVKTLINVTDSTIVIETKGSKIQVLYRLDYYLPAENTIIFTGDSENIVNLLKDVYGYQVDVVCMDHYAYEMMIKNRASEVDISKHLFIFTDRTITYRSGSYKDTVCWVLNPQDFSRRIYNTYTRLL